jgi:hypothetical protein
MQHIQDKDFDQLFKDRFEDAEITPSAGLWNNIQQEIKPKKRVKLPLFWAAAASVVVTVAIAISLNKSEKIQLHGNVASVTNHTPVQGQSIGVDGAGFNGADVDVTGKVETGMDELDEVAFKATKAPVVSTNSQDAGVHSASNQASAARNTKKENSLLAMQPISHPAHLLNMEPEITSSEQRQPVTELLPAVEVSLAKNANIETHTDATEALSTEQEEAEQPSRTRIRNAGDLVNFVVEKLDKRDQKILEFSTDDDDNTSLVAINIGPFKMNTKRHK